MVTGILGGAYINPTPIPFNSEGICWPLPRNKGPLDEVAQDGCVGEPGGGGDASMINGGGWLLRRIIPVSII